MGQMINDPKKGRSWGQKADFGLLISKIDSWNLWQREQIGKPNNSIARLFFWGSIQIQKGKNWVHKVYATSKKAGKIPWLRKSHCFHFKWIKVNPATKDAEDLVYWDLVLHPHSAKPWEGTKVTSQWSLGRADFPEKPSASTRCSNQ